MGENQKREDHPFLPPPGLLENPGGQEGANTLACISDIKGQKTISREKLDYVWKILTKYAERNRRAKEEYRKTRKERSRNLVRTKKGDYDVLVQPDKVEISPMEKLKIYEGVTLVRKTKNEDQGTKIRIKRGGGKKGKLTTFSKRSRLNMMKHLGMMKCTPEFWHDLTYPDDVMEGLTLEQKKLKSSEDLHQLKRWMERESIKEHGIWKREWKIRKSGRLKGTAVPHFHNVHWTEGADNKKYLQLYYRIAEKWLEIIGTQGKDKDSARLVLYHSKSFRFIQSQKQMRKYMQKYVSKDEEFISDESIGRSWGIIGDPMDELPEEIEIEHDQMVLLKRLLRRLCKGLNKKAKYGLSFCLTHEWTQFFVLMERQTVFRMMEYINTRAGTKAEGVPF
jgi:hypothetical protein